MVGGFRGGFGRRGIPWPIVVLLAVDVLLVAFHVAHALAGYPLGVYATQFFELELEQNLPTWFASVQLAAAAVLLGIVVVFEVARDRGGIWRRLPVVLPFCVLFLSLDEIAEIHEKLGFKSDVLLPGGTRAATAFQYTGIWMFIVGVPFLLVILFLFRRLIRPSTVGAAGFQRILLGFLVLIAGAGGVEMWANFTFERPLLHLLQVSLEEGLELLGGTLMVWGSLEVLAANGIRLVREAAGPTPRSGPSDRG